MRRLTATLAESIATVEGCCEYNQQAVADSRQEVILQVGQDVEVTTPQRN